ncbi:MAG: hypothetical protein D3908_06325, partial [Candidatus Electrothrix sp. AUS4]|nr:hypothetical protein [Candidatus Electrothrix sp. AUS4]
MWKYVLLTVPLIIVGLFGYYLGSKRVTESVENPDHHIVEDSAQPVNDKGMTAMRLPEDVRSKPVSVNAEVKNKTVNTVAEKKISSDISGQKKEVTSAESGKKEKIKDHLISSLKADGVVPDEEIDSLVE